MKHKPKLGQNFLVDDAARYAIVDALGDVSERTVIEIGPGHGAITEILAKRCRRLIAVELDAGLAAELRFRFREQAQVEIVQGDILRTELRSFVPEGGTADVVGNLPYYITSDILLRLFETAEAGALSRAVLMMQREVAERVAAAPGVRDYGLLSATVQMHAQVDNLFTLPPEAFSPPPDVYSTVLRLHFAPRFVELGVDAAGFDSFLSGASRRSGRLCKTTCARRVMRRGCWRGLGPRRLRRRHVRSLLGLRRWQRYIEHWRRT